MPRYIINKQPQPKSGDYEVHQVSPLQCSFLPDLKNRIDLGEHLNCQSAVSAAKKRFPDEAKNIDGCYYCSNACHNH